MHAMSSPGVVPRGERADESSPGDELVETAFYTAGLRALGSARRLGGFSDPFARMLLGDEAQRVMHALAREGHDPCPLVRRTLVIDAMLRDALAGRPPSDTPVDTIVLLGAGLDARPYRLSAPPGTAWIEVDRGDLLDFKSARLRDQRPVGPVTRIAGDVRTPQTLAIVADCLAARAARALVLTEGLLVYLAPSEVDILASALLGVPQIRRWVTDLAGPASHPAYVGLVTPARRGPHAVPGEDLRRFTPGDDCAPFTDAGWRRDAFVSLTVGGPALGMRQRLPRLGHALLRRLGRDELAQALAGMAGVAVLAPAMPHGASGEAATPPRTPAGGP